MYSGVGGAVGKTYCSSGIEAEKPGSACATRMRAAKAVNLVFTSTSNPLIEIKDRHHRSGAGLFITDVDLYLLFLETGWASCRSDLLGDLTLHASDGLLNRRLHDGCGCWLVALLHLHRELRL